MIKPVGDTRHNHNTKESLFHVLFLQKTLKKLPQHVLVHDSKGKFENGVAKSLGYGFELESFFPDSWGGEFTVKDKYCKASLGDFASEPQVF